MTELSLSRVLKITHGWHLAVDAGTASYVKCSFSRRFFSTVIATQIIVIVTTVIHSMDYKSSEMKQRILRLNFFFNYTYQSPESDGIIINE